MNMLDYNVIASGSSGNAVRIENIMIDCGIPFKKMKEELYKVDTLLITHAHSDHIKEATYQSIRSEFPRIHTYANADVAYRYQIDTVVGTKKFVLPKKRIVRPYDGKHDVPVTYFIITMKGVNILYATDTNYIANPDEIPIDYFFLESNYDERKLQQLREKYRTRTYDPIESSLRHLSEQKAKEFYYVNRRDAKSEFIELHKSSRFY